MNRDPFESARSSGTRSLAYPTHCEVCGAKRTFILGEGTLDGEAHSGAPRDFLDARQPPDCTPFTGFVLRPGASVAAWHAYCDAHGPAPLTWEARHRTALQRHYAAIPVPELTAELRTLPGSARAAHAAFLQRIAGRERVVAAWRAI